MGRSEYDPGVSKTPLLIVSSPDTGLASRLFGPVNSSPFLSTDDEILRFVWDSDLSEVLPLLEIEFGNKLYSAASVPDKYDGGEL